MKNKKGFTLLEILIAAAIMSILALMATAAYRHSISVTRVEDAKNKLRVVANAVLRFKWDYPNRGFNGNDGKNVLLYTENIGTCPKDGDYSASTLIKCEYLENRQWTTKEIKIVVCNGSNTGELCSRSGVSNPLACMTGTSSRLDTEFTSRVYCISESDEGWGSAE